jgi:hypothetical protein
VKPIVEMLSLNDRNAFWDRKLEAGDRWDEVIQSCVERRPWHSRTQQTISLTLGFLRQLQSEP